MNIFTTDKIRNVVLLGHGGCGKTSLAEAMAYQELGEHEAARKSLTYYAEFLEETYVSVPGLIERLDLIDPAPENYWSKTLPDISKKIQLLPSIPDPKLLETKKGRRHPKN